MEQTQIARLFGLFAGDDTLGETYGAVLETAVLEVVFQLPYLHFEYHLIL